MELKARCFGMKFEIFINSIIRLSIKKATKLFEEYHDSVGFKSFAEQQKALDILMHKINTRKQIKNEVFSETLFCLAIMARNKSRFSKEAFLNIKTYPMIIWIECIGEMDCESIMQLLNNFHQEFVSILIETCIINLSNNLQVEAITKYKNDLDSQDKSTFYNFYYSVCDDARSILKKYFPNCIEDDILFELGDLDEDAIIKKLDSVQDRLGKFSGDDLLDFFLLKIRTPQYLNIFLNKFREKINSLSISKFELLFTRYRYLKNGLVKEHYIKNTRKCSWGDKEEKELNLLTDEDFFEMFKIKFHEIGVVKTLDIFAHYYGDYDVNDFSVKVILEFIDIAYEDLKESKYVNDVTIKEVIKKFAARCRCKDYTIADLENLINRIGQGNQAKLINDDYIEAIVALGKLLKDKVINDNHPLFMTLRDKFTENMFNRCVKDGTYEENISLKGIFYRLAKGSLAFDVVYMLNSYKGLICLSKCNNDGIDADYIVKNLTDLQVAKLNIMPAFKWVDNLNRDNINHDIKFLVRISLQLLCFFGLDKGKYLLEQCFNYIDYSTMEYLFDNLEYFKIPINDDGKPSVNEELLIFLFGRGLLRENNSIINKMLRGEISEFKSYFPEFCNSYEETLRACNGVLTIKRIVGHFKDFKLSIELKPDEIIFRKALIEMKTSSPQLLEEAMNLCKDAGKRKFSSIPKVEGMLGDFTYNVLDLNDSMALAVGYLTHCCFVVRGDSYSALKHSMQSNNGRIFVVYSKGKLLCQSWIWRNGDVVCFDSVESGCSYHEKYDDDIKLVDVYKKAALQMLQISQACENEIERIKIVTVGASDYRFRDLEMLRGIVPRPLEKNLYVYDSRHQKILAGSMPVIPRYGAVTIQYRDFRKDPIIINDVQNMDIDKLDEIVVNIRSLRYQAYGIESPLDYQNYMKMISGDGWYILIDNKGEVESGILSDDKDVLEEYNKYVSQINKSVSNTGGKLIRELKKVGDGK